MPAVGSLRRYLTYDTIASKHGFVDIRGGGNGMNVVMSPVPLAKPRPRFSPNACGVCCAIRGALDAGTRSEPLIERGTKRRDFTGHLRHYIARDLPVFYESGLRT